MLDQVEQEWLCPMHVLEDDDQGTLRCGGLNSFRTAQKVSSAGAVSSDIRPGHGSVVPRAGLPVRRP